MTINILSIIKNALTEDIGTGDITTNCTVVADTVLQGQLIAKSAGVVAGLEVAQHVFETVDKTILLKSLVQDGVEVKKGQVIAKVKGNGRAILSAERVMLNFLQRMSGIATMTQQFVGRVQGTKAVILDTRKTVPGLRVLDKLAVQMGGGENHRFGLFDMVMIKDNHIAAAGSITKAVEKVREGDDKSRKIEVEVKNLEELQEVLRLPVDRIMLDNMSLEMMARAVEIVDGQIPLEASGNVNLENVAEIAKTGVDYISVGALTHSVRALDVTFLIMS
ncbi:carboxylating nicotinate-nucleotide diphosphorylase [bacterium]|jgi:nicotinate-nucleotide pyrophosphorylase (carboxylating)|nr:carboxylating nicotinate-nucleotide diphosphorylase [bacterium]MBT3581814.1 carboxylating nicotinate-nucleotide diphosphorylase [bacterium]MBT4552828.1 carboxylating nicotinate-nucleotide diphosphorylase [bacterium]MBT5988772.1 carboxylating nicotinate-nucleotide diphosphorylase [bacterium]MBT7088643.1 carboxylating nicotinate-nucleotide diphosphorylase [bacterium]